MHTVLQDPPGGLGHQHPARLPGVKPRNRPRVRLPALKRRQATQCAVRALAVVRVHPRVKQPDESLQRQWRALIGEPAVGAPWSAGPARQLAQQRLLDRAVQALHLSLQLRLLRGALMRQAVERRRRVLNRIGAELQSAVDAQRQRNATERAALGIDDDGHPQRSKDLRLAWAKRDCPSHDQP